MKTPIILFDVMETLVNEPFFEHVPSFFDMSLEELLQQKDPRSWVEFEHGRIDEVAYCESFFRDRSKRVDLAAIKHCMQSSYRLLPGVEELLADLKARSVPMYALSNYSKWYELIDEKLALSRFIDWSFVSCNTGVRKPDPEAYLGAARKLGVATSACIFVDDRAKNVDAAVAVGMKGVLRTQGIAGLRESLNELL